MKEMSARAGIDCYQPESFESFGGFHLQMAQLPITHVGTDDRHGWPLIIPGRMDWGALSGIDIPILRMTGSLVEVDIAQKTRGNQKL